MSSRPDFASEWARCAPWLEAALAEADGSHSLEDVKAAVLAGEADFWPGKRAAMVTEIITFPRRRVLNFWLAGGDLAELRDELRPRVEELARKHGCQAAHVAGRQGWARALGYRPIYYVCAKELA